MASLRAGSSESGGEDASWGDLFGRRYLKGIQIFNMLCDVFVGISFCSQLMLPVFIFARQ